MAKGQFNDDFGGRPKKKVPPRSDKNSSYLNKNTFPAIAVALSFLGGVVASLFGWALANDASWGFLLVGATITYAIFHYLVLGIIAFFRKLTGKQPEKKKVSSPAQIKLDNLHNDDGWD